MCLLKILPEENDLLLDPQKSSFFKKFFVFRQKMEDEKLKTEKYGGKLVNVCCFFANGKSKVFAGC